mmetsp:Transcript_20795/g.79750  ORF Transcript_20795/g.79750 Transcript_20795/m.79750 type:complete len:218 (-) Transcript_20795:109-762(-)
MARIRTRCPMSRARTSRRDLTGMSGTGSSRTSNRRRSSAGKALASATASAPSAAPLARAASRAACRRWRCSTSNTSSDPVTMALPSAATATPCPAAPPAGSSPRSAASVASSSTQKSAAPEITSRYRLALDWMRRTSSTYENRSFSGASASSASGEPVKVSMSPSSTGSPVRSRLRISSSIWRYLATGSCGSLSSKLAAGSALKSMKKSTMRRRSLS